MAAGGEEQRTGSLRELEAIHRRKTGALIAASLELGGIVAECFAEQLAALDVVRREVGLAFQITDDLLDVAGSQAAVGKRLAKDADRGKLTFPRTAGLRREPRSERPSWSTKRVL